MTGNLKTAFDGIRAEDKLKANTLLYLQSEMRKRDTTRARNPVRRFAAALAAVAVIFLSGTFTYNIYFTPSAYVDVDVNPSVELTLNRFDRVIGAHAYNEDGDGILSGLSLKHKSYEDALIVLIEAINEKGYIQNDGLVSVTLQTNNENKESELLAAIQTGVTNYMAGHHNTAQIDIFTVSADTWSDAHELNISPAKYLVIQELIEVDPTATVESCRDHSINEIRRMTQTHESNHHSNGSVNNNNETTSGGSGYDIEENHESLEVQGSGQNNSHHEERNRSGQHGGGHE